ncbi:thioesterase superfamily protein [Sporocytophaga myxococcoides]|uniref:Thioesterase superfamily protein n=1 Tax=Sporocytophaga myxococcoides TaxID=153721 RepID=A0A098LJI2_9BACT|nr:acyl-CoA thioesterase [Sporocytophaga myxococcoides]GAL87125.1 thioesterase superfamily protein [Sporocytophaga myxococcoides]
MDLETRIKEAETRQFKAIFPNTVNHYDTLFGGAALAYMDEVAFITATRFSKLRLVTVSTNKIDFKRPIPAGTIIEIVGKIEHVGNTSIQVKVEIYVEEMYHEKREKAIEGLFTMVAVGEDKKPVRILKDFGS